VTDKTALRAIARAARAARTAEQREQDRAAIRSHVLAHCVGGSVPAGSRIAAYEPLRTEPGSVELLAELAAAGYHVLVPLTLADRDLDWATWTPADLADPAGSRRTSLGVGAICAAALVLVPAFAVDRAGRRLGRGGGSYDRALSRLRPGTPVTALLYEDELVPEVPVEAWDVPVSAVVTPAGWHNL
jgi:5-formyltetrahydrofolate cyclo-ligase